MNRDHQGGPRTRQAHLQTRQAQDDVQRQRRRTDKHCDPQNAFVESFNGRLRHEFLNEIGANIGRKNNWCPEEDSNVIHKPLSLLDLFLATGIGPTQHQQLRELPVCAGVP
jgi:hypothetical protein